MKNVRFRMAAYCAYYKALRDGLLVRPESCSGCGAIAAVEGHHEDYARPFDVNWLCKSCHHSEHGDQITVECAARPRCLGCNRIIYKHILVSGRHARVYGPGFIHNRCARKADARIAAMRLSA